MQSHSLKESQEKSLTIDYSQIDDEKDEENEPTINYKNLKINNKF
jgi:hypothetical protein